MEELLTVQEVARLCRVHEGTIRRQIASGRLRSVRVGRAVRVRRDDLEAYLEPEPEPAAKGPYGAHKTGILAPDDPLFNLIGAFEDEPWVSSEKHRVLAEAYDSHP